MAGYEEVLGQDSIKEFFRNSIRTGNVPHACILSGEAGMGKRKLAETFARALLCEKAGRRPAESATAVSRRRPAAIQI